MHAHPPRRPRWRSEAAQGTVTRAELFLDLVFVFVITQVTHEVEAHPGAEGLLHALLPLVVVWWIFLGFGWLTNAVRPDAVEVRLVLTLAMVAFFILGLDLPFAFDRSGLAFPLAYLTVVLIHLLLYLTSSEPSARRAIRYSFPFNTAAGLLILLALYVPPAWSWACWGIAVLVLYLQPVLVRMQGFVVEPRHFVERYGLILLIVLGESLVAIGIGAGGQAVGLRLAIGVTLGIALAAGVWWVYFDEDEDRVAVALERAGLSRRQTMAWLFGIVLLVMVIGIVLIAAGITDALHHFSGHAHPWWLGCGTALFLLGHAALRAVLGTGRVRDRLLGATAAVPLGWATSFAGWAPMAAMTAVLTAVAVTDHLRPDDHGPPDPPASLPDA
ncbi:low temperature requirement protein A [Streptomyces sp. NPDC049837]|uniref:low temperature requirement protein A n=1 Tax=Streptomyces sp. NPDC049837 TaxID=3155277 RepID=UPI00343F3BD6